ncbi:MAG: M48 family metalloprotease [bacterium]|nr:M48 family metalloprotease [bacterium]
MASTYTNRDSNIRKTWFLMTIFFGVVMAVAFIFAQIYNSPGILYFAVIFSVVMNIGSYWFSDKIVLSMHHAVPVDLKSNPELYRILENLTITAGLPMPRFFVIQDPAPNAFATGRNAEHAVVCVTSGLLSSLSRVEIEGVLAHELSHIGNRDMLVSCVVVVLVGFISILSNIFTRNMMFRSLGGSRDSKEGGGIIAIIGLVLAILSPIIASLIQMAISRKREFLADASGVLLTRYPEGLASALQKIGAYRQPMQTASNATAHLFIGNPFGADSREKGETPWLIRIFSTHPPIEERVAALIGRK